jgi:hypothetical protein
MPCPSFNRHVTFCRHFDSGLRRFERGEVMGRFSVIVKAYFAKSKWPPFDRHHHRLGRGLGRGLGHHDKRAGAVFHQRTFTQNIRE